MRLKILDELALELTQVRDGALADFNDLIADSKLALEQRLSEQERENYNRNPNRIAPSDDALYKCASLPKHILRKMVVEGDCAYDLFVRAASLGGVVPSSVPGSVALKCKGITNALGYRSPHFVVHGVSSNYHYQKIDGYRQKCIVRHRTCCVDKARCLGGGGGVPLGASLASDELVAIYSRLREIYNASEYDVRRI
jgi:hypothetical protein